MINVSFTPTAINKKTGTVTVTDNATGSPQTVSLTGTGTEVQLVPSSLNFGTVKVGTSSAPQTVTLTNVGSTSMSFTGIGGGISIGGPNHGDFSKTTTCGSSVAAGGSCTVTVTFTPKATGTRTASLGFTDNGGGSPQLVPLSGTGD